MKALLDIREEKKFRGCIQTRLMRSLRETIGMCSNCDSTKNIQCHHIIKKANNGSDFFDNIVILCEDCHKLFDEWG